MAAKSGRTTYAHVECIRRPETNPANGQKMVPKLLAQCANSKCRKYLEMGSFVENQRHDLRCPQCGGFDFKLSWWMTSDAINPEPLPCKVVAESGNEKKYAGVGA